MNSSSPSLENVFIGISGLIGAGKSTLATALGRELDLPVYYEPVRDNEYLQDFYSDMKKYSFPMQIHLLTKRFEQQQQIIWAGKGGVQDRTIYEDSVFARMLCNSGHMEERDYRTYVNYSFFYSDFNAPKYNQTNLRWKHSPQSISVSRRSLYLHTCRISCVSRILSYTWTSARRKHFGVSTHVPGAARAASLSSTYRPCTRPTRISSRTLRACAP